MNVILLIFSSAIGSVVVETNHARPGPMVTTEVIYKRPYYIPNIAI